MSFFNLRWLSARARRLLWPKAEEAALNAELGFHFDQLVAQFRSEGMSEAEARLAAQKEFGTGDVREEIRDTWRLPGMSDLLKGVQFAGRSLLRTPGFTLVALLTLGLGIGANTAMFSMLNGILLKPLPYEESERIQRIYRVTGQEARGGVSPAEYLESKEPLQEYGDVAAFAYIDANLSLPGAPAQMVTSARVSPNFFSLLRVRPELGRDLRPEEGVRGNHRVVLISNRFWRSHLGSDPSVVGRLIRTNEEPHEIIGVLPHTMNDWRWLGEQDFFFPLALDPEEQTRRDSTYIGLVGKPRVGLDPKTAGLLVENIGHRFATEHPDLNAGSRWHAVSLNGSFTDGTGPKILGLLIGLSSFVLLIACSNLANYFLARTMARSREFALRSALGASTGQLLRPLVMESLILALGGAGLALLVAALTGEWLQHASRSDNGESVVLQVDWRVFVWAVGAALCTAFAFGVGPARLALRLNVNAMLKSGGRGSTGSVSQRRLGRVLIVGQFGLAMVLLAGAALFVKGLEELNQRRLGWESERVATGTILVPQTYSDGDDVIGFQRSLLRGLENLPGVESACLSTSMPFFGFSTHRKYLLAGADQGQKELELGAALNAVSSNYFQTLGTRLVSGRGFGPHDVMSAPKVYVISESMARAVFGTQDPVGRHLSAVGGLGEKSGEIIGVAADTASVLPNPGPVTFQVYVPITQSIERYINVSVRTGGEDPSSLLGGIRQVMSSINPDLPVRDLGTANAAISRVNYQFGVVADILWALGLLGLGLALLGVFSLVARTVAQRTNDFGIRLALGAQASQILRMVLRSGVLLALAGSALGLVGSIAVSKLIGHALPAMTTNSVPVLATLVIAFVAVALLACYIPARRAAKISPTEALRHE